MRSFMQDGAEEEDKVKKKKLITQQGLAGSMSVMLFYLLLKARRTTQSDSMDRAHQVGWCHSQGALSLETQIFSIMRCTLASPFSKSGIFLIYTGQQTNLSLLLKETLYLPFRLYVMQTFQERQRQSVSLFARCAKYLRTHEGTSPHTHPRIKLLNAKF